MFKKPLAVAEREELSAKDRKKLRRRLEAQFDARSVELLFQSVDRFSVLRFAKSKMLVYTDEVDPLLVDTTGGGDLFPTLYCLQQLPKFVKSTLKVAAGATDTVASAQIAFTSIDAGSCSAEFAADDVCALVGDAPVAVFAAACSSEQLKADPPEMIGYLLHHEGDQLWELGSKTRKKVWGTATQTVDDESESESEDAASGDDLARLLRKGKPTAHVAASSTAKPGKSAAATEKEHVQPAKPSKNPEAADKKASKASRSKESPPPTKESKKHKESPRPAKEGKKSKESPPPAKESKKSKKGGEKQTKAKPSAAAASKSKAAHESSDSEAETPKSEKARILPAQMDKLIREAFLNGIVLRLNDKDLPVPAPSVWKDYIAPFAPTGVVLDIKDSSFKKLNKFFQQLAKEGVIEFEEAEQKGAPPQVSRVFRTHSTINDFEPTVEAPRSDAEEEESAHRDYTRRNTILRVIRPMSTLRKYLGDWEGDYLTPEETRKRLRDTLKSLGLLAKEDVTVTAELDSDFGLGLLGEVEPEEKEDEDGEEKPRTRSVVPRIKFDRLFDRVRTHMEPCFVITTPAGEKTLHKGEFEGVRLYAEKAHNKVISRATGLELYGFDMEAVLADVCAQLNVTGSLVEAPSGKANQREVVISGGLVDALREFVEQRLRLPEAEIEVINKVDKKKKKPGFVI